MSTTPMTATLEQRFSLADESVLSELYQRYSGPMFSTALSVLGNRDMAADAVQRAFVQAWRAASTFDADRDLRPWLIAIVRRTAVDVYRRDRRSFDQLILDRPRQNNRELVAENIDMEQLWTQWQVREALEQLSEDERHVLQLAYYDGYSQSEVAVLLGIPIGTVKSRTARAQRRLAKLLSHLGSGEKASRVTSPERPEQLG
ncbi:RNA polymerase sigma factor [Kribbella sp. NPDC055071]